MYYPKSKVYFDGSHYIAIPHTEQPWKRRKRDICRDKNEEKVSALVTIVCVSKKDFKPVRIDKELKNLYEVYSNL